MAGRKEENLKTKLTRYCALLGDGWLRTDGKVIYCDACKGSVSIKTNTKQKDGEVKKSLVKQHVESDSHDKAVKQRKASKKPRQEFLDDAMRKAQSVRSEQVQFCSDLCSAFLAADIALFKVNHSAVQQFFSKYIPARSVPDQSTLSKFYVSPVYEATLERIRRAIRDDPIFVQVDETTKDGWKIAHCIVGSLTSNGPATRFLLSCEELERTNYHTVSQFVVKSLSLLWPNGIKYDKVLLYLSDAASYMKKSYSDVLKGLFPHLVHVTCIVHGLHRVAEKILKDFTAVNDAIAKVKKVFEKAPNRRDRFRDEVPNVPPPPDVVPTRWGSWLSAVKYYASHAEAVEQFLVILDAELTGAKKAKCITSAIAALRVPALGLGLQFLDGNYTFLVERLCSLKVQICL